MLLKWIFFLGTNGIFWYGSSFSSGFDVLLEVLPQDLRMLGHQDREGRKYWELYLMIQRVLAASGKGHLMTPRLLGSVKYLIQIHVYHLGCTSVCVSLSLLLIWICLDMYDFISWFTYTEHVHQWVDC